MIQIYHNPRCGKSRCAIDILEKSGKPFEIIRYLEDSPSESELRALLQKLNIEPIKLVRTNESIWKEHYKGQALTNDQIIGILVKHPILIERPVIVNGDRAVIGRPPENITGII